MPDMSPIKVVVIHEDPIVAAGLVVTLREQPGIQLVGTTAEDREPGSYVGDRLTAVLVTDYERGLGLLARARSPGSRRHPVPNVLVVTTRHREREIRHAMEQGARGYFIQGCGLGELVAAVRALHSGLRHVGALAAERLADSVFGQSLTDRETDVLRLLVKGYGNKAIARQLEIALGTVKSHLKTIFQKLDANSRTEVAAVAERRGLLTIRAGAPRSSASPMHDRDPSYVGHAVLMASVGSVQ